MGVSIYLKGDYGEFCDLMAAKNKAKQSQFWRMTKQRHFYLDLDLVLLCFARRICE